MKRIYEFLKDKLEVIFGLFFIVLILHFLNRTAESEVKTLFEWPSDIENSHQYCNIYSIKYCKKNDWFGATAKNYYEFSATYSRVCQRVGESTPDSRYVRHIPMSNNEMLFLCRMKDPKDM